MRTKGASGAPHVFVPQPVSGRTAPELRAYVDGDDQPTGRPLMGRVIAGLTRPVPAQEVEHDRSLPRLLPPAPEEELHDIFLERGWSDGLPVVLPTEERVAAMLAGTSRGPDEVVGRIRPALQDAWEYTVEQVAVNAVLAGARPECLPVILALAASGLSARTSSITAMASMAVVNGPVREELGLNAGTGALGPYARANTTIGRAYGLLSQNLQGGSVPGVSYFGSQGNPLTYATACFAENEERSPWEPYHVSRGYDPGTSLVTIFPSVRTAVFRYPQRPETWADGLRAALAALELGVAPVLVLDPLAAARLVELGGFGTRASLAAWMAENGVRPARSFWQTFEGQNLFRARAALGEQPWAGLLAAGPDDPVPPFAAGDVQILVVGGETFGTYRLFGSTPPVSIPVDDWR